MSAYACAVVSVRAGAVRWQPEAPHVVGEFAGGEAVNAAVHGDFVYVHGVGLPVEWVMDTDAFARVRPFVGKYVHAEEETFLADGGGYVLKVRGFLHAVFLADGGCYVLLVC